MMLYALIIVLFSLHISTEAAVLRNTARALKRHLPKQPGLLFQNRPLQQHLSTLGDNASRPVPWTFQEHYKRQEGQRRESYDEQDEQEQHREEPRTEEEDDHRPLAAIQCAHLASRHLSEEEQSGDEEMPRLCSVCNERPYPDYLSTPELVLQKEKALKTRPASVAMLKGVSRLSDDGERHPEDSRRNASLVSKESTAGRKAQTERPSLPKHADSSDTAASAPTASALQSSGGFLEGLWKGFFKAVFKTPASPIVSPSQPRAQPEKAGESHDSDDDLAAMILSDEDKSQSDAVEQIVSAPSPRPSPLASLQSPGGTPSAQVEATHKKAVDRKKKKKRRAKQVRKDDKRSVAAQTIEVPRIPVQSDEQLRSENDSATATLHDSLALISSPDVASLLPISDEARFGSDLLLGSPVPSDPLTASSPIKTENGDQLTPEHFQNQQAAPDSEDDAPVTFHYRAQSSDHARGLDGVSSTLTGPSGTGQFSPSNRYSVEPSSPPSLLLRTSSSESPQGKGTDSPAKPGENTPKTPMKNRRTSSSRQSDSPPSIPRKQPELGKVRTRGQRSSKGPSKDKLPRSAGPPGSPNTLSEAQKLGEEVRARREKQREEWHVQKESLLKEKWSQNEKHREEVRARREKQRELEAAAHIHSEGCPICGRGGSPGKQFDSSTVSSSDKNVQTQPKKAVLRKKRADSKLEPKELFPTRGKTRSV